tara:strand:+ start:704 stop:1462 length:759 start_codon:yes stop_codon:yes gene_type:complete
MDDVLTRFNDDEIYYADREYLSNSSLKLMKESPAKFNLWRSGKWSQPNNTAFDVGRALHARFLEDKVNYTDWNGARRGAEYKEYCAANPDTIVLTKTDFNLVEGMYDKLTKVDAVRDIMGLEFKPEVPGVMEYHTANGNVVKVKGKADALAWDGTETYLVDLKTTKDPMHKFKRNAFYNYAQQAFLYKTIFNVDKFYFLVVQKEFPFEVGIYEAGSAFLARGEKELEDSINLYEKLFIDGEFKPYSSDFDVI